MTLRALWPLTQQFQNKNGSNLVSGKVYIYYQGRTALATTYHDEEGTVVNANPVLLDNNGRATVFANTIYSYTIVVCDYYGKELFSQDITLHDDILTAKDVIVMGSDGSVKVDTTTLPNGVQYDLSVNTEKIATKESVEHIESTLVDKQDKLTPGSNIAITNNIISATGIPTKTSELTNDSGFFNTDDIYNGRIAIHLTPLQKYSSYIDINNLSSRFSGYIDTKLRMALSGTSIHVTNGFTPWYSDSDGVGNKDWPAIAYFEIPNFVADKIIIVNSYISVYSRNVVIMCYTGSNKFSISIGNSKYDSGWYDTVTVPIMF